MEAQLELPGLGSLQDATEYDVQKQLCGSKRKGSSVDDDVGTIVDQPNSSDEGADGNGSDDEARKLRRQLRNRLSAQQARDRKKAQMQQLQDQVLRQQQQMQQLQRQLADTEAANSALRNIICAMKGQPSGKAASPPQELQTARSEPAVQPGGPILPTLLTAVSAPLGTNTLSPNTMLQPQVPQHQQLQLQDTPPIPRLRHTLSDSAAAAAAAAAAAGVGTVDLLRRSCSSVAASAAAVAASPTGVAAMHFAQVNPFRRKSSSTVAALAGLLPIAQRMASDTGPAETTLQALHHMQQQQWQASADQSVLAAAASAANAAEAAAAAAASHVPTGSRNGSSSGLSGLDALLRTNGGGIGSAREDAQIKRRQLLLLLAQRDSLKKAGDTNGKPRNGGIPGGQQQQQQQQSIGMSLPQGYHQFRIPDHHMGSNYVSSTADIDPLPVSTQITSLQHNSTAPGHNVVQESAPQQQQLLSELLELTPPASAAAAATWGQAPPPVVSAGQQQQQQPEPTGTPSSAGFADPRNNNFIQQQQQQGNAMRGLSDLTGPSSGSGCGSASLGFGRAPSDGLFRLSSADVRLTDLLADMA